MIEVLEFCCPQCGGWAFGSIWTESHDLVHYECHSDITGKCLSMTNDEFDAGIIAPKREKPCGWRGKEFPK